MSDDEPTTFLIGGGWQPEHRDQVYGPFLAAAGSHPTIACVVLDEGDGGQVHWVRRGEGAVLVTGFRAGPVPDAVVTG